MTLDFPVGLRWWVPEKISWGSSICPGSITPLESDADNPGETDTSAYLLWLSLAHRRWCPAVYGRDYKDSSPMVPCPSIHLVAGVRSMKASTQY